MLLTPTCPQVAWKFGEKSDPLTMYLSDIYTIPINLAGNCAINVPCGFGESGMPIGLQIIGDYFAESTDLPRRRRRIERDLALDLRSPLVAGKKHHRSPGSKPHLDSVAGSTHGHQRPTSRRSSGSRLALPSATP